MARDEDELALAETTASEDDTAAPLASRDTLAAEDVEPTSARPAARLAAVDRERYVVAGELARGGLGRILRAKDSHLGRNVALKEMLRGGTDAERRFVREALITARLEHPAIVPVHDAGRGEDGAPFYAMKLVGGRPLVDVLAAATSTSERLALVPRILAVADAIGYAHSQRVIHRDLKPGNVLCGEFGETVVIDWGLAKDLDGDADDDVSAAETLDPEGPAPVSSQTIGGVILGTPAYMAPEQAAGAVVDERVDVYALGAMLYELLSGAPPHRGDTLDDVLRRVISGDLEPLERLAPDVPADLAAIVAKSMARDPEARYRTAGALAEDLRRYVTGQLVAVYHYGAFERLLRWVSKNRAAVAVAAVATAILAVFGVVAIRRIVAERDQAKAAREVALGAEREARERGDDVLIEQARAEVAQDPTRAIAILAGLDPASPRWSAARMVAADARERGLAHVLVGHIWATEAIAFDGDGRRVASLGHDGIRVWDRGTRTVRALPLPDPCGGRPDCSFGAWSLALSADGRWLAAGAGAVTRWDLSDLDRWDLAGAGFAASPPVPGTLLAVAPDGRIAVAEESGAVALVTPGGAREEILAGPSAATLAAPDAAAIVAVSADLVRVWRPGAAVEEMRGPVDPARVAVSPSGKVVAWSDAVTGKANLHVWTAGQPVATYPVPAPRHLVIARNDGAVMWDDIEGLAWLELAPVDLRRVAAPAGPILDLAPGPTRDDLAIATETSVTVEHVDGTRDVLVASHRPGHLAASGDGHYLAVTGTATVPVWPIEPDPDAIAHAPRDPQSPSAAAGFESEGTAEMATDPAGTTLVIDWMTGPVELWRRTGDRLEKARTLPIPSFSDLSLSPDGQQILFVDDDGAALLAVDSDQPRRLGPAQLGWFAPDGTAYTLDDARAIRRWSADGTGTAVCPEVATWDGEIKLSADGSTIASVVKGQLLRCHLATGALEAIDGAGTLTAWSLRPDGVAAAGFDKVAGQLVVLDASGRHAVGVSTAPAEVWLSADSRWVIAVAAEGGFTIVDATAGTARPVVVSGHMSGDATFLPGDTVAVIGEQGVVVADLATGASRTLVTPAPPAALAACPDAALLAVVGARVMVWLDDLPHDPAALRAWIESATDARIGESGELTTAQPFKGP